jgi:cytochrome c-type biogenesis protein CcmH/NrfG
MKSQGVLLGISGVLFGVLLGWILGSQQASRSDGSTPGAAAPPRAAQSPQAPPLDTQRAADLERQAKARPDDATVRATLGDLYFEAQRHDLAIPWYEAAIKLDRTKPQVHTDLALSLFYTNEIDRALKSIDAALAVDPRHLKALLSQGFIRAFGKQDLPGAVKSWEQVIAVDPTSIEAGEARRQLEGLKSAHPAVSGNGRAGGKRP